MATHHDDHAKTTATNTTPRRYKRARGLILIATAIGVVAACSTPSSSPTSSVATPSQAPNAGATATTIGSGFHGLAQPQYDVGRMDGTIRLPNISMAFRLSAAQQADREALIAAQQNPLSPSYRRWLSPEDYAARFGASRETIAQVTQWLQSQGFDVTRTSRAGTHIYFAGSVAQVEKAFQTEMHRYDVNGEHHYAPSSPATVSAEIGAHVLGVMGIDDFRPHARPHKKTPISDVTTAHDAGAGSVTYTHGLGPEDFATIYDVPNLFTQTGANELSGDGVKVAIVGASDLNPSDVATFRSTFKLPAKAVVPFLVPGTGDSFYDEDDMFEASLDVEWSGAVAPSADIGFYYPGTNGSIFDSIFWILDERAGDIMSASFSECESGLTKTDTDELLELGYQANLEGITFVAASGDTGPAGCEQNDGPASATTGEFVGFPSSVPGITSVGGTGVSNDDANWNDTNDANHGSAKAGMPVDIAWNDTNSPPDGTSGPEILASGGGESRVFLKPVWQLATGVPTGAGNTHRFVPDLSLSAGGNNVPYFIAFSYTPADGAPDGGALQLGFYGVLGTSASTPAFAGMLALLNQALVKKSIIATPGLGNVNPQLYALQGTAGVYRDVVSGDNCVPCTAGSPNCPTTTSGCAAGQFGYVTTTGYDPVTGLGTVDGLNMVNAWTALAPTTITLTATPNPQQTGSSVALKATVTSATTTPDMGGTVSFYDQNFDKVGASPSVTGNPGLANSSTVVLPPGTDQVFAIYTGDSNFLGSYTVATITLDEDAGTVSVGGGVPIVIFDAGTDAGTITPTDGGSPTDSGTTTDSGTITDSGTTTDAGHDSGTVTTDAGHDSGTVTADSGSEDSGSTGDDSGSTGDDDSGVTTGDDDDSGATGDDSGIVLGEDGGVIITPPPAGEDGGNIVDGSADGGGNGSTGNSSGCGCVTAGHEPTESNTGLLGAVMIGLAAIARRRRSRR